MIRIAAITASLLVASVVSAAAQSTNPVSQDTTKRLRLIGNGALGLHEGEDVQTGAFGVDYRTLTSNTTVVFTIEASAQQVRGGTRAVFANSILPVRNGAPALYASYRKTGFWKGLAVNAYFNGGNLNWIVEEADSTVAAAEGAVAAMGAGLLWNPLHDVTIGGEENHVRLYLGGGYTNRILWGDLARDAFMLTTLGTNDDKYHGLELVGILEINDAEIIFNAPVFFGGEADDASLAGGKWVVTVNLKAGLTIPTK